MKLVMLVAAGLLAATVPGVASAEDVPTRAQGLACRTASASDPTGAVANPGVEVGELQAGPVAVADLPAFDSRELVSWDVTGNPGVATVTCSMQVGGTGSYLEPDAVAASASGTGVVYLPPTLISYVTTPTDPVWLCSTWIVTDAHGTSVTYYYNAPTGGFTTNPGDAQCELLIGQSSDAGDAHSSGTSAVRADAYGHIVITGDSSGLSFTTTDRYLDSFACGFTSYSPPTVTCHPTFPNAAQADAFYCEYWILTAKTSGSGKVRGQASCLGTTGTALQPGDVSTNDVQGNPGSNSQSSAQYYDPNTDVTDVVCQAWGINGGTTPVNDFTVDCYEPGLPLLVH